MSSFSYIMDIIDNGDLHIDNIAGKIQMIKALIETLKKTEGNMSWGSGPWGSPARR